MFNKKKMRGTDDEVKAEILSLKAKEYLSRKPQIETGFLLHDYIDNYIELCRLRRIRKTSTGLNKIEQIRLHELEDIEKVMPSSLVNEFKSYLIESDADSRDTLDKVVKRVKD